MVLNIIFINMELHDIVTIYPWQLNNELYLHIKNNLKNKIEKKCTNAGYICKIKDIVDYKDGGSLQPEDLTGNVVYRIRYNCLVCNPIPKSETITKIEQIIKGIIMSRNGPVLAISKMTDINTNLFSIDNLHNIIYISSKQQLKIGNYIKITIKSTRFFNGDDNLGVIATIDDIATQAEITEFMYNNIDDDDVLHTTTNKNIIMNEDEQLDDIIPTQITTTEI